MAIPHHLLPPDLIFELRRARAKVGNKSEELKCLSRLVKKESIDAVYKNVLSSLLTMNTDEAVAPMRKNGVVAQRKKAVPLRKRKRKDSPVGRHDGRGKARVGDRNKVRRVDRSSIPYQGDNVGRARSDKMYRKQTGKFKGVVKEEDEVDVKPVVKKEYEVKKEKEIGNQDSCSTNNCARRNYSKDVSHVHVKLEKEEVVQGDNVLASKAIIKKEPEDFLESRPLIEGQSSSGTVQEVEILDSDMVLKKGITNPFVSATLLDLSMANEEAQELALVRASYEFREEILKVLSKPYDKEEHQRAREAIRVGSYLIHHPDLHKKLKKYRYRREKHSIVLRGFLFWLQNLTREGAFKPWKDEECLKVELKP